MDDMSADEPRRAARPSEKQLTPEEVKAAIQGDLGGMVEIMMPGECDEPILEENVRRSVFEWMTETRAAKELKAVGLEPRLSCLLYGPPGCGKTTLAHHFAARVGMPLVVIKGEMLVDMYLGSSGRNISQVFSCLRKHRTRAIGFLDEIDSIATKRSSGPGSAAGKEQNAIVTALLTNIESLKGMFFAATNRHDAIDPAIWRRFSMHIDVRLPAFEERFAIMKRYGQPFEFTDGFLDTLANVTTGAAPSLLRQLMEGIKRALVLGPRIKRDTSDPLSVIADVVAQVQPHPMYLEPPFVAPPLWKGDDFQVAFLDADWPPVLPSKQSKQSDNQPESGSKP